MRTFGSPKTPRTTGSARKPSNEYVSQIRRRRFDLPAIHHLWQISSPAEMRNSPEIPCLRAPSNPQIDPLDSTKSLKKYERTYFLYFSILERQRFRSCRRIGCVAKPLCDRWRQWALRVGSGLFAFGGIADMNS
jgi:hypothetical protein